MSSTSHLPLTLFLLLLSVFSVHSATRHAAAPAPSVDCTSLVLNMADCLSYVSSGSTTNKPEGTCCSGLKTVLKTDAQCLCEAFKSSAQFGVVLNVTKALTLPAACKINAPSASNCGLSLLTPSAAPGASPISTAPTTSIGSNEAAPAPSPGGTSGAHALSISIGSLAIALTAALFRSF